MRGLSKLRGFKLVSAVLVVGLLSLAPIGVPLTARASGAPTVRNVPADYPTVQAAVDAAANGDVVLIAPGVYVGPVSVSGKAITIASHFLTTGDPSFVDQTVLDGGGGTDIIDFGPNIAGMSDVIGITARNATNGISGFSPYSVYSSHITDTSDAIDYEYGAFGGTVRGNLIDFNSDDAVDFDSTSWGTVEYNRLVDNDDDGIEIRLPDLIEANPSGYVIRGNVIARNGEDGLQMIGNATGPSTRPTVVEGNLFEDNAEAAFSMMCCSLTSEDFGGAALSERYLIHDNTFRNNGHGVIGGDNVIAVNNIFEGHDVAIKRLRGDSIAAHNLFSGNTEDLLDVITDGATNVVADPLLATDGSLGVGSPAIDAGVAQYVRGAETLLDVPSAAYTGSAPDLGAFEVAGATPWNEAPFVSAGFNQTLGAGTVAALTGIAHDDGLPGPGLGVVWSEPTNSGNVTFDDPSSLQTTVTLAAPGTYHLRLTVSDGLITVSSTVTISSGVAPIGDPTLVLNRLIETAPFVGSSVSVRDNEGSAYVPADNSLWIVSDNDSAAFEIDPDTGVLRRTITQSTFANAQQFGGGPVAGNIRSDDFESVAYDAAADELFMFSGSSTAQPTVFRLSRDGTGQFQVDSWQPLANSASYTASGWRSTDGKLYVVQSRTFATYDYVTNTVGTGFEVAGIRPYGIDFADDGDLLAVTTNERLIRADFETARDPSGMESRPDAIRRAGQSGRRSDREPTVRLRRVRQPRVSDDPKEHAVFVFDVSYGFESIAPTASFTTSASSGAAPLTVTFTDTSTGTPGSASWDFGDGLGSSVSNPSHVFTSAGDFTVTLTVTNDAGTDSASTVVSVTAPSLTTIVTPVADSYISSSSTNKNYGDRTELKLLDSSTEYRPFLRFDVQGLSGAPRSATLRVFVSNGSSSGGAWYSVTAPWSENTITWANAPAVDGSPIATVGAVPGGVWTEIDVSDVVTGNGSYSFAGVSNSTNTARFSSREGSAPAELVIEGTGQPTAPTAGFTPSRASGEAPLSVDFTDTSAGGVESWAWDFGDGDVSAASDPSHTFVNAGDYTVALTVTNGLGTDTASTVISVSEPPPPEQPAANFTATPTSGNAPLAVSFTDTSTGGPESWAWDFGDGTTASAQNPNHVYGVPGLYTVGLTVTNAAGSSSVTLAIDVTAPPAESTFEVSGDSYVSVSSASKNYGTYADLKLLGPNGQYEYRPYFQFDVSGLAGAPTAAVLRVHVTDAGPSGGTWRRVSGTWDESTINWSNAPPMVGPDLAVLGPVAAGEWIEIDVTGQILGDGTYSFAASSVETNTVKVSSRESGFPAELVIVR